MSENDINIILERLKPLDNMAQVIQTNSNRLTKVETCIENMAKHRQEEFELRTTFEKEYNDRTRNMLAIITIILSVIVVASNILVKVL